MSKIKDIIIKIRNDEALTLDEFNVAKESGLNGIKIYNSEKRENEYFIVYWKDNEIVVDGELISTYGVNFTYRDVIAKKTDNLFTLHETHYEKCEDNDEFQIDDDFEIRNIVLGL